MRALSLIWVMTWRDLRARLLDRSALMLGVVAPFVLMAVMSLAMGGSSTDETYRVGFVASDTPVSQALAEGALRSMVDDGALDLTTYDDSAALRRAIRDGDEQAGIATASDGVTVLTGGDSIVADTIVTTVARSSAATVDEVARTVAAARALGAEADPATVAGEVGAAPPAADLRQLTGTDGIDGKTQIAAGMATFFLFFTVQFGLVGLAQERREGTLPRLLAAPVRPWHVLAAKVLVSFLVGLGSMVALVAASSLLLGTHWGSPLGVALLILGGVLAAVSTVALVVGVTRTSDTASAAQAVIAIVLGILGGAFFSMERAGGLAAFATRMTPHYWFKEGLVRLSGGEGWTAALEPAGWMLVFALVIGIPGLLLAHRTVRP